MWSVSIIKTQRKKHPYVKPFSTGLRDCPGQRIARLEFADFATKIITNFEVTSAVTEPSEPDLHYLLLTPKPLKLTFTPRYHD